MLVKPHFLLIIVIGIVFTISLPAAYSEIQSNNKYTLQGNGLVTQKQTQNSKIELHFSVGNLVNGRTLATVETGIISLSDKEYLVSKGWLAAITNNGDSLVLSGDAQNLNGDKIHLNLFGIFQKNQDVSTYQVTGTIIKDGKLMKVSYNTKVSKDLTSELTSQQTKTDQKSITKEQALGTSGKTAGITKNVPLTKIILVTKHTSTVQIAYSYTINAKVYYANQNPTGNFDQYYGFIPNAKVNVQILDPDGLLVKSFTGFTDNYGYYTATFRIPDNFRIGTYSVLITAQMGDASDNKKLTLYIQQGPY